MYKEKMETNQLVILERFQVEWPRFSFHIHSGLEQNRIEIRRRRREGGGRREARKGCEDSVRFQGSFWSDCEVRAVPEQFQSSSGAVPVSILEHFLV